MRDSRPAKKFLTGLRAFGVTTPHGWSSPDRALSVPRACQRFNDFSQKLLPKLFLFSQHVKA